MYARTYAVRKSVRVMHLVLFILVEKNTTGGREGGRGGRGGREGGERVEKEHNRLFNFEKSM